MGRLPISTQVKAVVVEPQRPERVYVAGPSGVFKSDDAGQTWQASSGGLEGIEVVALSLDPAKQDRVFAGVADGRVFTSDDGGASWRAWHSED